MLYSCGGTLLCFLILKLLSQGDTFEKDFKIRADSHNVMIGLRHPGFLFWPFFHYATVVPSNMKSYLPVPAALVPSHPKTQQQEMIGCKL